MKMWFIMKKLATTILIFSFFVISGYSQKNNSPTESQKLSLQVSNFYKQGKLEEAIPLAERIVEIQRKDKNGNLEDLATALKNLFILQKLHYDLLVKERENSVEDKDEWSEAKKKRVKFIVKYVDSIPALFDELTEIYEKKLKTENLSLAEIKFEYASYLSNTQRRMVGMRSSEPEKAEKLFNESLRIREKLLGESDDLTASSVLKIADFYYNEAEYEKSLSFYLRFIDTIKKKYGEKSEYLLSPLRKYLTILTALQFEQKAEEIRKNISNITGKPESLAEFGLDLTLRNKEDESAKLLKDPNTITDYLKTMKFLLVEVTIDEKGKVIETKAGETDEQDIHGKVIREKAEKDVTKWRFKPFIYDGAARKAKGIVWFPYFIKA